MAAFRDGKNPARIAIKINAAIMTITVMGSKIKDFHILIKFEDLFNERLAQTN